MNLPEQTITFPAGGDIVYVIGFQKGNSFVPIYVGESSRNIGRFGDYVSAKFSASTDFKVGMAVKYLQEQGRKMLIKYKDSPDRKAEQDQLIRQIQSRGFRLLNDLKGYDYKSANEQAELVKIRSFVDEMLKSTPLGSLR